MTPPATTPSAPIDYMAKRRALQDEEQRLRDQAGTITDTVPEMTRRLRLEQIEAELREVHPLARAQEHLNRIDGVKQGIKEYEASCAAILADAGPAVDGAIETIARELRVIKSALPSGDVIYGFGGLVSENQLQAMGSGNRLNDLEEWVLSRVRVACEMRDEPISSSSSYRQHTIGSWLAAWTGRHVDSLRSIVRGLEHRAAEEKR